MILHNHSAFEMFSYCGDDDVCGVDGDESRPPKKVSYSDLPRIRSLTSTNSVPDHQL